MTALEVLITSFSRLPGLGVKTAARMVFFLLKADPEFVHDFAQQIRDIQGQVRRCTRCAAFTEESVCLICNDITRDEHILCVVEEPQDVLVLEGSRVFNGKYHVLNGTIDPMKGLAPSALNIPSLQDRIKTEDIHEIIIATNPTLEGDTTALYLQQVIPQNLKVSRIAFGMPIGGNLEYAGRQTLARALQYRTLMEPG